MLFMISCERVEREPSYSELDGDRKVIHSRILGNDITAFDTRQVNKSWLDDALLASDGFEDSFDKAAGDVVSQ